MKRILSFLMIVGMLVSAPLTLPTTATGTELEELSALRAHYNTTSLEFDKYDSYWGDVYYPGVNALTVLLYTDLLSSMTLKVGYSRPAQDDYEGFAYAVVLGDEPSRDETELAPFEWLYCEELEEIIAPHNEWMDYFTAMICSGTPNLKYCVQALSVSKEELYAAREKMYTDPLSIRDQLPITDKQAEKWLESLKEEDRTGWALQDFMIEALYLKEETTMHRMLLCPWYQWSDVGPIGGADLYFGEDMKGNKIEDWKTVGLYTTKEDFEHFYKYCTEDAGYLEVLYGEVPESMRVALEHWKARVAANPPKTGDATVLYALIFTLSALPAAGLTLYGAKRRRRRI